MIRFITKIIHFS